MLHDTSSHDTSLKDGYRDMLHDTSWHAAPQVVTCCMTRRDVIRLWKMSSQVITSAIYMSCPVIAHMNTCALARMNTCADAGMNTCAHAASTSHLSSIHVTPHVTCSRQCMSRLTSTCHEHSDLVSRSSLHRHVAVEACICMKQSIDVKSWWSSALMSSHLAPSDVLSCSTEQCHVPAGARHARNRYRWTNTCDEAMTGVRRRW